MAFDFPNSPTEGASYSPAGGPQYVYRGGVWRQVTGSPLKLTAMGDQNLVVNPTFIISQENGTTEGTTSAYHIADQWMITSSGFGAYAGSSGNDGSDAYMGQVRNTAAQASVAATAYMIIYQLIEGIRLQGLRWGSADAIPAVLNFKARATAAGTYSVIVKDQASSCGFAFDYTLPAGITTWQEFTVPIPVPPAGTWNTLTTAAQMQVQFAHSVGSTYRAPVSGAWSLGSFVAGPGIGNNGAAANNRLQVKDVQLLPDPDNTGIAPKFVAPEYGEELDRCQRYWESSYTAGSPPGSTGGNTLWEMAAYTTFRTSGSFTKRKRTQPAVTVYSPATGAAGMIRSSGGVDLACPITAIAESHYILNAASSVAGNTYTWQWVANARL